LILFVGVIVMLYRRQVKQKKCAYRVTVGAARAAANGTGWVIKSGTCKSPSRLYLMSFLVGLNGYLQHEVGILHLPAKTNLP
jgi:hypothetical protein